MTNMIPNFKTDAKMLAKTLLQILCILLVSSAIILALLSCIVKDGIFVIGPEPSPTEIIVSEGD